MRFNDNVIPQSKFRDDHQERSGRGNPIHQSREAPEAEPARCRERRRQRPEADPPARLLAPPKPLQLHYKCFLNSVDVNIKLLSVFAGGKAVARSAPAAKRPKGTKGCMRGPPRRRSSRRLESDTSLKKNTSKSELPFTLTML